MSAPRRRAAALSRQSILVTKTKNIAARVKVIFSNFECFSVNLWRCCRLGGKE